MDKFYGEEKVNAIYNLFMREFYLGNIKEESNLPKHNPYIILDLCT